MSDSLPPHGLLSARLFCPWALVARALEWVATHFSWGSSPSRDPTRVSSIAGIFFFLTIWATTQKANSNFNFFFFSGARWSKGKMSTCQDWIPSKNLDLSATASHSWVIVFMKSRFRIPRVSEGPGSSPAQGVGAKVPVMMGPCLHFTRCCLSESWGL